MPLTPLAALPLETGMIAAFVGGVLAGAVVNWAAYWLAWNQRLISPWSPPHADAPPRRRFDRTPIFGWFALRREAPLHGRGFWIRPAAVELFMGAAWAALYWWEVGKQSLVAEQFEALAGGQLPPGLLTAPMWTALATFASHAVLATLMAAASLIDLDEKTIPDDVTVPGTLLGLALAAVSPHSLLPHVALRSAPEPAAAIVNAPPALLPPNTQLYVEPLSLVAPEPWPKELTGWPNWLSLAIGLGCFLVWCLALAPRRWRTRRGAVYGLRVLVARVVRELARPPLMFIAVVGSAAIAGVWAAGGASWLALLTALVGMIGASAMVWGVRIVATSALRREALGFGDVTLMMMIGAYLGWQAGVIIFFVAPFFALLAAALQLVFRRDDEIPYGPHLCLAAALIALGWARIWNIGPGGLQAVFELGWWIPGILAGGVILMWAMLVLWRNIKEAIFR